VVLVIILFMIIKALAGGGGESKPSATPPPNNVSKPAAAAEAAACTAEQLTGAKLAGDGADVSLTPSAQNRVFGPDVPVTLNAQVKNVSSKDCTILTNPRVVSLIVISWNDPIFDSAHCATEVPEDAGETVTVKAGQTATVPVTWNVERSQQGCPEISQTPARGRDPGATYEATVTIAGVKSDVGTFYLAE
jgi:hypothetical protein